MKVLLSQGEMLTVELLDADGSFVLEYGFSELSVTVDLPDADGRSGKIYSERYNRGPLESEDGTVREAEDDNHG